MNRTEGHWFLGMLAALAIVFGGVTASATTATVPADELNLLEESAPGATAEAAPADQYYRPGYQSYFTNYRTFYQYYNRPGYNPYYSSYRPYYSSYRPYYSSYRPYYSSYRPYYSNYRPYWR